jgi:hypothetical protein
MAPFTASKMNYSTISEEPLNINIKYRNYVSPWPVHFQTLQKGAKNLVKNVPKIFKIFALGHYSNS